MPANPLATYGEDETNETIGLVINGQDKKVKRMEGSLALQEMRIDANYGEGLEGIVDILTLQIFRNLSVCLVPGDSDI
jgi:hypothetical protein